MDKQEIGRGLIHPRNEAMQDIKRGTIHNLNESMNVLDYIIQLVEQRGYRFDDGDAPQYIAEMKKVLVCLRETRQVIQTETDSPPV